MKETRMPEKSPTLSSRREFLFCYDIKMGNPNGDPDENRPRVLPDKTHYVTDVRLKRFVRDFLKSQGQEILVDTIEGKTTNLTGRVAAYLQANKLATCQGAALVDILLNAFIDARLFGSSFAFKKQDGWEPTAEPKTLTGAVQIQMGEVKHMAQEVDITGTSVFGSAEEKTQGTFTTYYALRYALIAFNGVANQHSARISRLTDADYETLLRSMWYGVRSAGNTRTKRGQVPRLLVNIVYKAGEEFQFGNLMDYLELKDHTKNAKQPHEWASPADYIFDVSRLLARLTPQAPRIQRVEYCASPDAQLQPKLSELKLDGVEVVNLDFDKFEPKAG
jgi:CRISPR-associated protein Csh2